MCMWNLFCVLSQMVKFCLCFCGYFNGVRFLEMI